MALLAYSRQNAMSSGNPEQFVLSRTIAIPVITYVASPAELRSFPKKDSMVYDSLKLCSALTTPTLFLLYQQTCISIFR
jgi:hypothetical protein